MRGSVLTLGLFLALGCNSDSAVEPTADLAGTWNIATVNGAALPFRLSASGPDLTVELMDDQIIAYGDKTWIGTSTYRRTDPSGVSTITQVPSGTWTQTGTNVTLNYAGGAIARATIAGDVITFTAPGLVAVYERQ